MKMLFTAIMPHGPFNAAVKDGTAGPKLNKILEAIQPEAVYFTALKGRRAAVMVVDLPDPSKIPAISEPWMLTFEAEIEMQPFMSPHDLQQAGLDEVGKKWC